jgi:hypothetical protein
MAAETALLDLVTPTQGTLTGTWGNTVNNGITEYVDIAIAGTLTLTGDGAVDLVNSTGNASATNIVSTLSGAGSVTAQFAVVNISGTTTTKTITGPSTSKTYIVDNTGSFTVTFKASGQTGVSVVAGEKCTVYFNGTDYVKVSTSLLAVSGGFSTTFTVGAATNVTLPSSGSLGYLNIPQSGSAKTTSYTLATSDIGEFIEIGSGGSIVVPNATFSAGDAVVIFNNTSGAITLTMSITTAYIGGTDSDKATISLATRGICNVLFISGTVCVVTGNVT